MAAAMLPQFALGALAPALTDDLGLSAAAFGALIAAYYIGGAALSPPVARLVGIAGSRTAVAALPALTALGLVTLAVAPSYWFLFPALVPAAAAAAAANPATNMALADVPPPRALLVGTKQSGVQLGALLAGLLLPSTAVALGWRQALALAALACVLMLPFIGLPLPRRRVPEHVSGPEADLTEPSGMVAGLARYAFLMGAGMAMVTTYIVLFANLELGMTRTASGLLLTTLGASGVLARLVWSRLFERRSDPAGAGPARALLAMAAASTVGAAALASATAAGPWLMWPCAAVLGLTGAAWNALGMLVLIEGMSRWQAVRASGVVLAGFYLGMGIGPPVFGALVVWADSYPAGWALATACFAVAMLMSRRVSLTDSA